MREAGLLPRPDVVLLAAAGVMLLGALAALVGTIVDPTQVLGVNAWLKPLKFGVSLGIYLATMAFVVAFLPRRARPAYAWIFVLIAVVELAAVSLQAFRGRPSHHNFSTPFDAGVYVTMGIAVVVNTLAVIVLMVHLALLRSRPPAVLHAAIQLGLLSLLLGSVVGGLMSAQRAHAVGAPDGGPGLPLVGWSTRAGDLRVAHFLGLHGLQVVLAVGLLVFRRWAGQGPGRGIAVVVAAFVVWTAVTAGAFAQALAGRPIIPDAAVAR